jgi:hypothetical protein
MTLLFPLIVVAWCIVRLRTSGRSVAQAINCDTEYDKHSCHYSQRHSLRVENLSQMGTVYTIAHLSWMSALPGSLRVLCLGAKWQ